MILYNHPAENFWGEFLVIGDQQSNPIPPSPTCKSAYNEQGFFYLSKIRRYVDKKKFQFSMPNVCT